MGKNLIVLLLLISIFLMGMGMNYVNGQERSLNNNDWPNIHENVMTDFNSNVSFPTISKESFIHPFSVIIGACEISKMVFVAPTAVCRGDEGTPIHVGEFSNLQDGVVIHALETTKKGVNLDDRRFSKDGDRLLGNDSRFEQAYSVFVGNNVSLAHGSLIHNV